MALAGPDLQTSGGGQASAGLDPQTNGQVVRGANKGVRALGGASAGPDSQTEGVRVWRTRASAGPDPQIAGQ